LLLESRKRYYHTPFMNEIHWEKWITNLVLWSNQNNQIDPNDKQSFP